MKKHLAEVTVILGLILMLSGLAPAAEGPGAAAAGGGPAGVVGSAKAGSARLSRYFVENRGQMDPRVKYFTQGRGGAVFFTRKGVTFTQPQDEGRAPAPKAAAGSLPVSQWTAVRLTPAGLRPGVKLEAAEPLEGKVSFFIGNDPKKWRSHCPTYRAVIYREAYRGIDLKFYGNGARMEYDVIVKAGADPGQVRFRYAGARRLEVNREGDLVVHLPGGGSLLQKKPVVYQEIAGTRVAREGKFRVRRGGAACEYGFDLAAYDRGHALIIDPELESSRTFGGSLSDSVVAMAQDATGRYLVGNTFSTNFPTTPGVFQPTKTQAGQVAFLTKYNLAGDTLLYSTYLGGTTANKTTTATSLAVDSAGQPYVAGHTNDPSFPTTAGAYQTALKGNNDIFVTKLKVDVNSLEFSTFVGGSLRSVSVSLGVSPKDRSVSVIGHTSSPDFPTTPDRFQDFQGASDIVAFKLDNTGQSLSFSTFVGGTDSDYAAGMVLQNNLWYFTGYTRSFDFPVTGDAYQRGLAGATDVFIAVIKEDLSGLKHCTFLGGTNEDTASALAVDNAGRVYVAGSTSSTDFPTRNAWQKNYGGGETDAFVACLKKDLSEPDWSTYFGSTQSDVILDMYGYFANPDGSSSFSSFPGGTGADAGKALAADQSDKLWVAGCTDSTGFPTKNAMQPTYGGGDSDAFVAGFKPDGTCVLSSYLGGSGADYGRALAADQSGNLWVAGSTTSTDFPKNSVVKTGTDADAFFAAIKVDAKPVSKPLGGLLLLLLGN